MFEFVPLVLEGQKFGIGGDKGEDIGFDIKAKICLGSPLNGDPVVLVNLWRCRFNGEDVLSLMEGKEHFEHS